MPSVTGAQSKGASDVRLLKAAGLLAAVALLAACGDDEVILPGERLPLRDDAGATIAAGGCMLLQAVEGICWFGN